MLLSKEQILGSDDLAFEDVEIPEWGGAVRVKTMTGTERDDFEASVFGTDEKDTKAKFQNFRAKLLVRTLVNENGNRLFEDSEVEVLGKKSGKILDPLYTVALRVNGIGKKDVEEMTKN